MSEEFFDCITNREVARLSELLEIEPKLAKAKNDDGLSALMLAKYYRADEIASALLARLDPTEMSLFEVCAVGNLGELERRLHREATRATLGHFSHDGFTALHLAAFFGNASVIEQLFKAGCEVDRRSSNGAELTALHSACARGHASSAKVLLEAGANPNAVQSGGFTPLHSAAHLGLRQLAELLLASGANLQTLSEDGKSCADLARGQGHDELANWLEGPSQTAQ